MKSDVLLDILFELLSRKKLTARWIAERHSLSVRSVYRYVDILSLSVPIFVERGRYGGIYISDTYKLPVGFMTQTEYQSCIDALDLAKSELGEEKYELAKRKLTSQMKKETRDLILSGNDTTLVIDGGTWGDSKKFSDKLRYFEQAVKDQSVSEIEYHARNGEITVRKIEPHVLVLKQGVWYVYAFCRNARAFRLFRLGRIRCTLDTGDKFVRRPIDKDAIPLNYWTDEDSCQMKLSVESEAVADVQDFLGVESFVSTKDGKFYVEATLPFSDTLVKQIIGLGDHVKVLEPEALAIKVKDVAKSIVSKY